MAEAPTPAYELSREDEITLLTIDENFRSLDELHIHELSTQLLELVRTLDPPLLVINLEGVNYFGSSFLEILFRLWNQLQKKDGELVLCSLQEHCREVIHVSNLDQLWKTFPSQSEALDYLRTRLDEN